MIINPDEFEGWEKDSWKITQAGNYAHFIAKNKYDPNVLLFLTDPGGRGDNWKVKVGKSSEMGKNKNAFGSHTSFDSKKQALLKAGQFMEANPKLVWDSDTYPNVSTPDGEAPTKPQ